jgi:hypothetical protein
VAGCWFSIPNKWKAVSSSAQHPSRWQGFQDPNGTAHRDFELVPQRQDLQLRTECAE